MPPGPRGSRQDSLEKRGIRFGRPLRPPCAPWRRSRPRDGQHHQAMIGGATYLMEALAKALRDCGIRPLYAFSTRVSVEQAMPDGSVRKVNEFRHLGFVG